ncbi:hypothetical protein [Paenibacillus alvei]|uniref:hypothetical protein n=1 Tax=Paenibacillus alvei TaxID=44250 RepID=UPI001FD0507E|nr:hypothetical protein [Paenibacillus alvei]
MKNHSRAAYPNLLLYYMLREMKNSYGKKIQERNRYCIGRNLIDAPPGEAPNHPLWVYSMIPLGAVVITSLFDYVIKFDLFDFFKKKK